MAQHRDTLIAVVLVSELVVHEKVAMRNDVVTREEDVATTRQLQSPVARSRRSAILLTRKNQIRMPLLPQLQQSIGSVAGAVIDNHDLERDIAQLRIVSLERTPEIVHPVVGWNHNRKEGALIHEATLSLAPLLDFTNTAANACSNASRSPTDGA